MSDQRTQFTSSVLYNDMDLPLAWSVINETNMEKRQKITDYWTHMENHIAYMQERLNKSLKKYPNPKIKIAKPEGSADNSKN